MKKRVHIIFSGRVQGVGFRFTAVGIAQDLHILGWVRNLPDSRVELTAEAEEEILQKFLSRIESSFSRYINDAEVSWFDSTGEFKDFGVKF